MLKWFEAGCWIYGKLIKLTLEHAWSPVMAANEAQRAYINTFNQVYRR